MKRILRTGLYLLFLLIGFSCTSEEKAVFEQTASERIQNSVKSYKEILVSSEYGWAFEFYTGGEDLDYGGFMYTLNFTEEDATAMMVWIGSGYKSTSSYNIVANGGPTLIFDEYNPLYHYFGNPSSWSPEGLRADTEYLMMSYKDDIIYLKGKKYGVNTRLVKLKEPADGYIDKTLTISSTLDNGSGFKTVTVDNEIISFERNSSTLTFSYSTKEGKLINDKQPYIVTSTGIRFYDVVTINGINFQELLFDANEQLFKSPDNKVIIYLYDKLPFDLTNTSWKINPKTLECSNEFNDKFDEVDLLNTQVYSNEKLLKKVRFGKTKDNTSGISFASSFITDSSNGHISVFNLSFSIPNDNELDVAFKGYGSKGESYKHLLPLVSLITNNGPYTYEMNDPNTPTKIKLTSKSNPNLWFTLNK